LPDSSGMVQIVSTGADGTTTTENHYTYGYSGGATATSPQMGTAGSFLQSLTTNPDYIVGYPDPFEGKEYQATVPSLLQTQTSYGVTDTTFGIAEPCQSNNTLLDSGQTRGKIFLYERDVDGNPVSPLVENLSDVYEYDYGAAPGVSSACSGLSGGYTRRTHTDYVTNPAYTGLNLNNRLFSLPLTTKVFGAGGALAAQTNYEYDVTTGANHAALTTYSSIPGWDASLNSTTQGNVTQITRQIDSTGATVHTYAQYDVTGNVVTAIDANGNSTSIQYSAAASYGLPTTVTNALGQSVQTLYDLNLAKPTSITDPNGAVTTFTYNDPLNRTTQIVQALGTPAATQTTFTYDDVNQIVTATSDRDTLGDNILKSQKLYDGLGRETQSLLYGDANGTISVQTQYDGIGRVSQVSNPMRPSDPLNWTAMAYDGLSRVQTVTEPGSAATRYQYTGNTTTVFDPVNNARASTTDGLGRLTKVVEDPSSLGYTTNYVYDPLDNLTTVNQGAQTRSFAYDMLSRLKTATNPESGAVNYTYDADGNVLSRIDARPITTTFGYDALNRLTTKSYSDSTPPFSTSTTRIAATRRPRIPARARTAATEITASAG
jgi:YD repeat-containing protein